MAWMTSRPCRAPRCPRSARPGGWCAVHGRQPERDRRAQQRFYASPPWRRLRALVLAQHPVCQACDRQPSKHVDHIQSRRSAPRRQLDPTNMRALCPGCHGHKTATVDGGFGR